MLIAAAFIPAFIPATPCPARAHATLRVADSTSAARSAADTAKTDSTRKADTAQGPAPVVVNHVETALGGLKLSGYGEAAYAWSNNPAGRSIDGRLYDRFQDAFTLNAFKLVVDRPYDPTKLDAGVHADLLFGQNAAVIQSGGLSLGPSGDMTQLYVTLNVPTPNGNGVQFKVGKIATLLGLEVIEDPVNPNWSEGNQFIYVENFTATGLSVEYKFNLHLDMQLRLINGWDVVQDNNTGKSFMGRVGVYPDTLSSIGLVGYVGPEESNSSALRSGVDVLLWRKLTSSLNAWVQGDYGREAGLVPDSATGALNAADWWALGGWVTVDLSTPVGLAFRVDYVDDRQGVRSNGVLFPVFETVPGTAHQFGSATATLNLKVWHNALVRPEVRYDHSNLALYGTKNSQVTLALATTYIY